MKISENTTTVDLPDTVALPEFYLECQASFEAERTKDFQKLLEDVQKAADKIPLTEEVSHISVGRCEYREDDNIFTITLKIRATSWFNAGEIADSHINRILADAEIVQHSAGNSALQRFNLSRNERFVIPSGHWTRDISEAA